MNKFVINFFGSSSFALVECSYLARVIDRELDGDVLQAFINDSSGHIRYIPFAIDWDAVSSVCDYYFDRPVDVPVIYL